jgi:hypothetical protein
MGERTLTPTDKEAALQAIIDEMTRERKAMCEVLGCVDLPGVPLKFIREQRDRLSKAWQREVELLRSWDDASLTERQELDRMRRGWGPTTPTERMRRKDDVRAAMHCLSSALGDLTLSEDEAEAVDQEVLDRLDAAYQTVHKQYVATIAILNSMDDPIPLPDLEASPHV